RAQGLELCPLLGRQQRTHRDPHRSAGREQLSAQGGAALSQRRTVGARVDRVLEVHLGDPRVGFETDRLAALFGAQRGDLRLLCVVQLELLESLQGRRPRRTLGRLREGERGNQEKERKVAHHWILTTRAV